MLPQYCEASELLLACRWSCFYLKHGAEGRAIGADLQERVSMQVTQKKRPMFLLYKRCFY